MRNQCRRDSVADPDSLNPDTKSGSRTLILIHAVNTAPIPDPELTLTSPFLLKMLLTKSSSAFSSASMAAALFNSYLRWKSQRIKIYRLGYRFSKDF
jgi:hypothetical protein